MLNTLEANKLTQAAMIYLQDSSCSPGSSYWYKKPSEASISQKKEDCIWSVLLFLDI